MRSMCNVMIHEYFVIDLDIVWKTVREDLPQLKEQVRELLDRRPHSDHR